MKRAGQVGSPDGRNVYLRFSQFRYLSVISQDNGLFRHPFCGFYIKSNVVSRLSRVAFASVLSFIF